MNNFYNPYQQSVIKVPEVNGLNGANAYNLAPNSSVLLLDNNEPIVFLKQTDSGGFATITTFDLVEHKDPQVKSMEDINIRLDRLEELLNEQLIKKQSEPSKQLNEQPASTTSYATMQNAGYDTKTDGTRDSKTKRS